MGLLIVPCEGAILGEGRDDIAVSCAKMAEPIEIPSALWTPVGPRKHVLQGGAHWHHLANTTEPSVCGGDAAFLSNYFDHLFISFSKIIFRY